MNADTLLKHFDRISDTPDAVVRFRQFILELAVRGKLVEQSPSDEPALELLKCIQNEKNKRIRSGHLKKQELLPQVTANETWFNAPSNWHWTRLGTITQVLMGQSPPGETYNKSGDGVPLINGPVEFTAGPFGITIINQYTTAPTNMCEEGDLLLCVRGSTTGRTNIAGFNACIGRGVAAIRPFFSDKYVRLFIWRLRASIIAMGRGIAFPSVSRQQIAELPIPLPPLAEQHRIVSKVDELMALCDQLEAARFKRELRRDRLVASSLNRISTSTAEEAKDATRFHLNNLPRLTTRIDHIKQLRQTILNLAVCGRLVPQDPNDEPAAELLKRIQMAEKVRLVKEGKIKKEKIQLIIGTEEALFELPSGWGFVRWNAIAMKIGDIDHQMPETVTEGVPYVSPRDFLPGNRINFDQAKLISREDFVRLAAKIQPEPGDLIYPRYGTIGENRLVMDKLDFLASYSCCVIKTLKSYINPTYQYIFSISPYCRQQAKAAENKTTQANVGIKSIQEFIFPLPPLAEQHRIVAKVDELMALCDQLETQLTTTEADSRRLLEAVLCDALNPVIKEAA